MRTISVMTSLQKVTLVLAAVVLVFAGVALIEGTDSMLKAANVSFAGWVSVGSGKASMVRFLNDEYPTSASVIAQMNTPRRERSERSSSVSIIGGPPFVRT